MTWSQWHGLNDTVSMAWCQWHGLEKINDGKCRYQINPALTVARRRLGSKQQKNSWCCFIKIRVRRQWRMLRRRIFFDELGFLMMAWVWRWYGQKICSRCVGLVPSCSYCASTINRRIRDVLFTTMAVGVSVVSKKRGNKKLTMTDGRWVPSFWFSKGLTMTNLLM